MRPLSAGAGAHSLSRVANDFSVLPSPPIALTIAGFDPSSGAGVTADLQTFAAHGIFGTSAVTGLTVQSTLGVRRIQLLDGATLRETLDCLEEDLPPVGIKIGMLGSAELVSVVAEYLRSVRARRPVYVVLDPVLRSSSGAALLDAAGVRLLRETMLALCDCATPNRAELALLCGEDSPEPAPALCGEDLVDCARRVQPRIGGRELIVTGGDEEKSPNDLLLSPGDDALWLTGQRVETTATHGTGCAFSSALLSRRLKGEDLLAAARGAKFYVEGALRTAAAIGHGRGPMNLLWTRRLP